MPTLITFTTDFGEGSPYVAQMKAAALAIQPAAVFIDITHAVPPQDVRHGAVVLDDVAWRFPPGTIHVCVVDPGVGTVRKIVYACLADQHLVAPDNGVLSLLARRYPPSQIIALESPAYWHADVSATFHGRDIMAPVAAHVSLGVAPRDLGPPLARLAELDWPEVTCRPGGLAGEVILVDHFGNLITNIRRSMLPPHVAPEELTVYCGRHVCEACVATYGQVRGLGPRRAVRIERPSGNRRRAGQRRVVAPGRRRRPRARRVEPAWTKRRNQLEWATRGRLAAMSRPCVFPAPRHHARTSSSLRPRHVA